MSERKCSKVGEKSWKFCGFLSRKIRRKSGENPLKIRGFLKSEKSRTLFSEWNVPLEIARFCYQTQGQHIPWTFNLTMGEFHPQWNLWRHVKPKNNYNYAFPKEYTRSCPGPQTSRGPQLEKYPKIEQGSIKIGASTRH